VLFRSSAVILALMSNTVAKGIYFGVLAHEGRRETAWRYAVWTLAHLPFALLW
jgi:hypothetical protein